MKEYNIKNTEVILKEKCSVDDLIDAVEGNCVFIPALNENIKIGQLSLKN